MNYFGIQNAISYLNIILR